MYHKVDEVPAGVRHPGNYVRPARFAEQLAALSAWGYAPVTLDDWVAYRRRGTRADGSPFPPRPLALTFDDGYASFADVALPLLQRAGWSATVFVVSGQVGGTNAWDRDERQEPLLDAAALRALPPLGIGVGSHTRTHRPLARIPAGEAAAELAASRDELEQLLGAPVTTLAYPFNNQSPRVRRLARRAGYAAAVMGRGRVNGRLRTRLGLYRLKVDLDTTLDGLEAQLERPTPLWPF